MKYLYWPSYRKYIVVIYTAINKNKNKKIKL